MSDIAPERGDKMELDDSGCIQDQTLSKSIMQEELEYTRKPQLLDLSDDVLLYILKYCSPHDLKALGYTCSRLGSLVLEKSLWVYVDARDVSNSRARMRWIVEALHLGTRALLLTGHATQARGCRGHVNRTRKVSEEDQTLAEPVRDGLDWRLEAQRPHSPVVEVVQAPQPNDYYAQQRQAVIEDVRNGLGEQPGNHDLAHLRAFYAQQLPRQSSIPAWSEPCQYEGSPPLSPPAPPGSPPRCPGPVFTLSAEIVRELRIRCPQLAQLSLQYCNINCNKINIGNFPASLRRLSLKGTRCYNPPLDKSYLFKIHDHLPALEYLDVSECAWLEPAALLPLSKLGNLKVLLMKDCPLMAEFVAYISLATRYGFRALQVWDLRGTPVGDSEVSALGWLPQLEELYLSAPAQPAPTSPSPHHHYVGDPLPRRPQLDDWEMEVPEYYSSRTCEAQVESPDDAEDVEAQVGALRAMPPLSIEVRTRLSLPNRNEPPEPPREAPRRRRDSDDDAPNKRARTDGNSDSDESDDDDDSEPKAKADQSEDDDSKGNEQSGDEASDDESEDDEEDSDDEGDENSSSSPEKAKSDENKTNRYRIFKHKNSVSDISDANENEESDSKKTCKGNTTPRRYLYKLNYGPLSNPEEPEPEVNKGASTSKATEEATPQVNEGASTSKNNSKDKSDNKEKDNDGNKDSKTDSSKEESDEPKPEARDGGDRKTYKYAIDVNDGASTSRYSIKVQVQNELIDAPNPRRRRNPEGPEQGERPRRRRVRGTGRLHRVRVGGGQGGGHDQGQQVEQAEPRHNVLYVTLGQQLHAVYRLLPSRPIPPPRERPPDHLQADSLVSDNSIRRFGRAAGEDVNIVILDQNGPRFGGRDIGGRPNRSNLRILSATGYRNITNRSLVHLATAAPHLRLVDFTGTRADAEGAEQFRSLRPEVEVRVSEVARDEDEEISA